MRVLAIDPSIESLRTLAQSLGEHGYELQGALGLDLADNLIGFGYRAELILVNLFYCEGSQWQHCADLLAKLDNPKTVAILDTDSISGRMLAQSHGFQGVITRPFEIESTLSELERVAPTHPKPADVDEQSYQIDLEVVLEINDEEFGETLSERTFTQEISATGAVVVTMHKVRVGELLYVTAQERRYLAEVRSSYMGNDYFGRLRLAILDCAWENLFTGLLSRPAEVRKEHEDQLAIGNIISSRYQLMELIGMGGMGMVYRATDLISPRPVAIKFLIEPNQAEDRELAQQLFEREIKILKQINHESIVKLLDAGMTTAGQRYLVMEYIEGELLDDVMEREGLWSVVRTLNLLKQICPALQTLHDRAIIHRDLKPANIMIHKTASGEVAKLIDFGVAKMVRGGENSLNKTLTKTGMAFGTLQYTSPEQCLGKKPDERTDIYALGMMCYELLTGRFPFDADSVRGWLLAHVKTEPLPVRRTVGTIPAEVDRVILWALGKQPEQRPQTVMEFLERFKEAAERAAEPAAPATGAQPYVKKSDPTLIFPVG